MVLGTKRERSKTWLAYPGLVSRVDHKVTFFVKLFPRREFQYISTVPT